MQSQMGRLTRYISRAVAIFLVIAGLFTNWFPFLGQPVPPAKALITLRSSQSKEDPSYVANCSITRPTSVDGDVMLAIIQIDGARTASLAGWTQIAKVDSSSQSFDFIAFYKVASGESGSTYDFDYDGSGTSFCAGGVLVYTGVDGTSPINATSTAQGTATPMSGPPITPTADDAMLVRAWAIWNDVPNIVLPVVTAYSGPTKRYTSRFNLTGASPTAAGDIIAGMANETTDVAKATLSSGSPTAWMSVAIALKSANSAVLTLNAYRWYMDTNAIDVTRPWGLTSIAQNTAITVLPFGNYAPTSSVEMRLRVNMGVTSSTLVTSTRKFKLQFKTGTDGTCTTGSWTDVGEVTSSTAPHVWKYASSNVAIGTTTTVSRLSPTSDVLDRYIKSATSTTSTLNLRPAAVNQTTEFDFHIQNVLATSSITYSFRPVLTTGALLSAYTVCPTLTTAPATENQGRHGQYFSDETEGGLYWADE